MRILITTEFSLSFQCGVTAAVINEKKCLEALGHEIRILTIYEGKKSVYKDGVYYMRSNFPQLYKDSYATLIISDPIFSHIYEWKPDIVHSQCEFFTMICAKKIVRHLHVPLVHTCHTEFDAYGVHFTHNDKLWSWATSTFIPRLLKRVDYIICPTRKNYELLKSYGVCNPMTIFPCGVDLSRFRNELPEEERMKMRKQYGFKNDDVVFVSICRLSAEKNVEESISNFASLSKVHGKARLLIVGDGDDKDNLISMTSELRLDDKIRFAGAVSMDNVWKYYKVGDIFISSSVSESLGLTYIEALASSIPIICREDKALSVSLEDGVNGFAFSSKDEFISRANLLLEDSSLRLSMGESAAKSVEKFSLENFAINLLEVFNTVLEEKAVNS